MQSKTNIIKKEKCTCPCHNMDETIWNDDCCDNPRPSSQITGKPIVCNCRGNLNANNPALPCSSCGGTNPKDENSYPNIWDNKEVDATNFKFPEFEVSPPQSEKGEGR